MSYSFPNKNNEAMFAPKAIENTTTSVDFGTFYTKLNLERQQRYSSTIFLQFASRKKEVKLQIFITNSRNRWILRLFFQKKKMS